MKAGDRKVYVIDGNVVQYTDKSGIDVAKSDKSIVVCDAETGKYEYTSPDQLMNVGEPADPSTLSEAYMANERAKEAAANGEGTAEGNAAAESNAAANGDVSADGGKAEVVEPAYTDGSRVEINGHEYDVKSAGEKTVVLVDEHGKELAWTRSALDAKLESGDAEVLEPKAEAAPDVATEGLKAGDVFEDSDGNALTVKRVDGDKVVAVGADGKAQTYEDGTFEQMVESGVLKRETTDLNAAQTGSPEGDGVPAFGVGSVIELEGHEYKLLRVDKEDDTVYLENVEGETELWSYSGICIAFNEGDARLIDNKNYVLTDNQGNPVNEDGTLKVEEVKSVDELTDEDFSAPTRNVQLPALPQNVDAAIGANGKPVIIKKNIFEKNWNTHRFPFEESRAILNAALYNTDLVGQTQPNNKPLHWVAIKIDDKSPIVVLEVNENKDNIEIVGWYTLDERNLNRIKRQAEKNGGELVMLSPKDKVESLSTPQTDLSSESKGTEQSSSVQVDVSENAPMPMRVVGKGKNAVQEEDWLATTPKRGHDYVFKESGLDAEEANAFVENKVAEAEKNLEKVKGKAPKMGTNIAAYKEAKADYEARVAEAQKAVDYWHAVKAERDKVLLEERRARKEKDKALYDDAVAQEEQRKAEMAQKAAEQEALGSNAVAPAIKEKWENAPKVDGGADEITLPNGEVVTGHYVLTESGAASASHQATNGFAETEGYPVDVNGETVNDRDYKRDAEAQQVTRGMAADYDSRALQSPVVVSGDGVVLSGNGRTMAGEIAALNGSDAKYNAYLRGHAGKFGFTTEQVEGFKHPRVVFVPDGEMPYTSETFAKFNQREQKSQSRTEMAVKLGKVVDDALFGRVMDVIGRHESLAEFYADDAATASVVKELADAGVIPQTEMAQLFDGGRLSESGQAMVEGVLVGKVFQGSPDAVRQITEVKSMRKAVMAALPEVVACHRLGGGYDLSKELAAAVDLVYKARKAGFKLGQHVSQHARQGNLFQLDDGATVADYNNAAVMMLADVMNDGRVTQLKKVLSFYNTQAADSAQGIGDMFAGGVKSKGQIINEVNELLNNGQEYDRRTPSVADGQGVGGEGGEQGDVAGPSHQGGAGSERGLSEAFDGLAAQLKTADGEERKRVLGEMRDGIARFAEENGYHVPEFLLTREDFLAAVSEKDRAKYVEWLDDGAHMPAYYTKGKVYVYVEGCETFDKDVNETLAHEYTHADNAEFPENVNALTYALEDTHEVTRDELREILREMSQGEHYDREAERLEAEGKDVNKMLADEVIAHAVARMVRDGEQVLDGITKNPTLQFIIKRAYKVRENERQYNIRARENAERHDNASEGDNRGGSNNGANVEGESANGGVGRPVNGSEGGEVSSERGRSTVSGGKEVAAPSLEGAKVGVANGVKSSATGDVVPSGEGDTPLSEKIATASAEVNTEPTEAQKEAGNYKKGHVQVGTFDITIEQPQGSVRKGTDADGKQWESKMNNTYGYIRGAVGVDGDHIDVFLSNDIDGWNGRKLFVVDQYNPDGSFDEHKVMLGFNDADEAKSDYLANYENGWENGRRIDVTAVNLEDFEKWIASSKRKTKPFGEYSSVKNGVVPSGKGKTDNLRQQKAVGKSAQPPTREESILRDVVIEHMKGSGLDVIGTEDGQRVLDMVNEDGAKEHRVYHGSGAEFDHFDHSHMGEGEGAQAYGWGTYVTEVRGIGEGYAIRSKNGISMSREEWSLKRSELESNIYRAKEQLPFLKGEYKAEVEAQISEWEEQLKDYEPHNYLYTVEIPDDNGGNYLDWNGPVPAETIDRITEYLREKYGDEVVNGRWLSNPLLSSKGVDVSARNGAAIYRQLERALGSDKKASLALAELGYAGIKYPAEFRSGGRKDDAKNYVIFNENDAEITDHVRFFKTKNGEAYGFTVGGKIYYDPRIANAETPVHEYAHLWASALKANNAKEWNNVVDLMKGTNVWEEVKKTYPELETDDEIADEVLATYSGRRGAERLREEMRKAAAEGDGVMGKAEAVSALQRVKRAIDRFWKAVADFLHIHYTSAEEVADRVMKDLLDGVDPRSMMDGGKSLRPETRVNVVEAEAGHGFKNYAEAKTWAKEHIARTYSGEETGGKGDIRISNAAVDKYLSQSAVDKSESKDVHLAVLKVLPDVIRESVDAEQHADFKKGKDGVRSAANGVNPNVTIHRLYGAVRMDGKLYRVKVTLKENTRTKETPKAYSYEATKIELLEGSLSQTEGSHNLEPSNSKSEVSAGQHGNVSGLTSTFPRYSDKSITAANLLNGVEKSYDGGKFFEDYNKIREQFIGEKGAAAADHADEVSTRLDNLGVAREMEADKKDAKAIKMATGWERGADGKWRYEVGDVRFYDGLQLINRSVKTEATLNDLLEDNKDKEALFASYPSLKNMPVVLEDMGYKGAGEYNYGKGTIRLNTYLLTDDDGYFTKPAVEILNHEIQHAIQKIEGFARGGSPAMVRSEIKKQMAEVTKQIRQLRAEGKEAEAKELIKKNRGLYEASVDDDDFGSYKSLAGEVESRNVESRMGMSAAERRASLAAETEDVSREDQIFLTSGDGGETAHSVEMVHKPSKEESILRDVVIEHMKGSGLDVIGTEDGQRVLDMVNDDGAKEHRVYHGSGAEFDHFDHSHMGEGEGAQAYGWGTYVTEVEGIGRTYAIQNSENAREHYVYSGDTHGLSEERINEILEVFLDAKPSEGHVVSEYNDALDWYSSKRDEYCQSLAKDASLLNPSDISIVMDKTRNLYTVEIPDDNGKNYLDWNSETGKDLVSRLVSILRADKELKEAYEGRLSELNKELDKFAPRTLFSDTYVQLAELLGSDKKASQLLSSLGYVGIKYPADNMRGGREDGAKNYVIFNENDAEITDHVRFFKTKNGEAYGFTVGGKIYYDPRIANAETPVHEYAHLWASALKANNAKEWKNVVDLMKGTNVWEEVKKTYPELETDDEIADEVLATYSGRRGAERLREEMRKAAAEGDGVMGKAEAVSALQRVKRAIDRFWKAVADFLHIHYTSAEEVADRVMKDLLDGVDPRKFMGNKAQKEKMRYQFMSEKGAGENVRDAEDYTAFASRYGVSADMVKDYALGIKTGNLHRADFALAEIRRTMRVANRGMKLSEFGKLFRPVQKELAERYGDIEVLRQEYIDAEMRERGVMEAARKRAEEETAKRKARADELRLLPAEELDRRYFEAVERGDDAAAREMLDEAARRKGYDDTESEYQGVGAWVAPSNPDYETDEARRDAVGEDSPDLNVEDMAAGYSNQPEDIFVHPDKYSQGLPTSKESGKAIQTAIDDIRNGKKEVKIKVYRAVPTSVKESKLRNGDWVTPSKEYAEMHGNNRLEGKYRIIEDEVPAGELWWDGNDVNEWGFDDGKGYKYKNVENSRKLNDLVTRDDNGEIIAPSKRFDENVEDVRYRTSEELGQEYGSRWIDEQTNEDGRHTTQVKNTLNSYKKFGDWVKRDSGGRNVDVLDASSGLGLGTEWLRENGINVEDVEPYPSENRTAPTYRNYDEVGKKYDYIISNAVLNVIPDDWRANVLHNMAEKLKVGGKLVINVRSAESIRKQGKEGETRITLDDPSEILVLRPNGSIKAYQKGFTKAELKEWCEKELGKGYSVEIANDKNAGGSYDTAAVVTKNNESGTIGVASEAGRPRRSAQALPSSNAKLDNNQKFANNLLVLSENLSERDMGAHEFLFNVAKAFGLNGQNLNKSFYQDLSNSVGIRISDHSANTDNITNRNVNDDVYGLVVKLSKNRFKSRSDANYLEYVYYPDKLTGERQREIVEGLNKFLQTGDYMQLPAPDRVNRSGKFDVLIDGRETSPTAKHQAANDLARQMHVEGEVEVVTSTEGLTGRQAKAKGWYDVRTGKVTIVLPNNKNAADVRETVFHEVVAHKGLRNLVGEEHFNTFLDNVYNNAEEGIKQTIDEMAEKRYKGDKRKATEEYMAHLAEDGEFVKPENQGFFAKVRNFLTDLLRKVGIKLGFKLTDNDLRYILWRSWKGLAERDGGSVFEKAEDVKMQHELGQTDEARSASGENGIMFREGSDELKDVVEKMKADVERLHEGELDDLRSGARAIGGRLSELNKAMRLQRAYDMSTVASVTELAKTMLKNGLLSEMSDYDVRRLLSVVNNVHGKGDIRPYVQKVVDMMVGNRLRNVSKAFDKLLAMRGKKVDARGVEVQGELDLAGQRMADVVWKGIGMSDDDVADMCADAQDRMMSANGAEAAAAATDYAGWQIVMRYNETIRDSKSEEVRLREDLKRAKEDYDAGRMTHEAYIEFRESTNDAIRENRIERAEAYEELYEQLGGAYGESIKRAADFKAAEKARVLEIQHNANSDMEGRPARSYRKDTAVDKVLNSSPVQLLFAPLGTFDQMLRMFGSKNVKGEGYLWNRYMRGWLTATENEYTGYRDATAELDAKAAEVLGKGKTWADLFALERKLPKATVRVWDNGEMRELELPQGNLLYIYMVDKMADGRMKLRKMGVTEDDVAAIEDFLDPRLKEIGDWLQEVYLVEKRGKYNEVHERMFGAAMASIDNYFPLKILKDARAENVDVGVEKRESEMASTITGSVVKRTRNALALDLLNSDAFSVVLDHLQQMEHWSAFAEWNRDLNTLLSYKHFRNQVKNMRSAYGSGERLWEAFDKVARIAAGTYTPPKAFADKLAVNIAKGVTAAKISLRVFTALKQFTSFPAYLSDSNPVYLLKGVANPYGSWKWCMENLPLFEKRWKSRMAGDPRLLKNEMDWSLWRDNVVQMAAKWGMTPNGFVDALTVCIGARAMYETRRRKYIRYGYGLEEAERRAKQDASILYNQTQQSSEGAFLSALQVDRSWYSVLFTVFRNSSMSYTRQLYAALRNTGRRIAGGAKFKGISEAFMAKQMERDGIDPDKASKNAKAEYRKSWINDLVRAGVFGYVLQLAWNCGPYALYMLFGDDEKKGKEMWHDIWTHTAFGSVEGLTGGDVWSAGLQSLWNHYVNGEDFNANSVNKDMPLTSDLLNVVKKVGSDNYGALNDVLNLLVQAGFGVNPQTLTDAAVAIYDYCGSDVETTKECALLVMRVMNCPQSQMDNIYFDEIDATGEEAKAMSVEEIAERYARYKALRSAPLRALSSDALKAAEKKPRERVMTEAKEQLDGRLMTEEAQRYLDEYEATKKKVTETRALADTDPKAFMQQMPALARSGEFRRYRRVGLYKSEVNKLTKKLLRTSDPAERRALFGKMLDARDKMLKQVREME